jgi:ribonuclease III
MAVTSDRPAKIRALLSSSFFGIDEVDDRFLPLYDQALTHSSYAKEKRDQGIHCQDYERLEFLGDYILNCAVAHFLYRTYDSAHEGTLSAKIKFTQNTVLAGVVKAKVSGIQALIRRGNNQVITDAILADVFEALIGAIYLDPSQGLAKVHQLVSGPLAEDIKAFDITEDFISSLQIYVQQTLRKPLDELEYIQISDIVDSQNRHTFVYEVRLQGRSIGQGSGSNSQKAKQSAAKAALYEIKCSGL